MRVLIGCEESGVVREAFRALGHDAWSNDIQPARDGSPFHIQGDVFDAIAQGDWDIIILHPPCTAMALSGNRWYGYGMPRHMERLQSVEWTMALWRHACAVAPRVAMENPVGALFMNVDGPVQYIQPWQFGHPESKKTGLALFGLRPLVATDNVKAEMDKLPLNERQRVWRMGESKHRQRNRSQTYAGIARAMAEQWGGAA